MARGGARPGAGRPAGSRNKATADVMEAAQVFTRSAVATLASIMRDKSQPAAARVSAATAILDRGHGKPKQAIIGGGPEDPPVRVDLSNLSDEELAALEAIRSKLAVPGGDQGGKGAQEG